MCRRSAICAAYRSTCEYINAWFRGDLHLVIGVATPAARRTRSCAHRSLCQLINRRFAVHAPSDVPNKNFSKTNDCSVVRVRVGVRGRA